MSSERLSNCPLCSSGQIDEGVKNFDGICEGCGFVVHDRAEPNLPEQQFLGEAETESQDDWLSVCQVRNASEEQIAEAFDALERISDSLGLRMEVRQKASDVYADGWLHETTDGRKTRVVVIACLRIASLQLDKPIPLGRLTNLDGVDTKKVRLACSALQNDVGIHPPTPEPVDFLSFLQSALELNQAKTGQVINLLEEVAEAPSLVGKDPAGTAAAAAYLTGGVRTQQAAAEAVALSGETIRLRVQLLRELMMDD